MKNRVFLKAIVCLMCAVSSVPVMAQFNLKKAISGTINGKPLTINGTMNRLWFPQRVHRSSLMVCQYLTYFILKIPCFSG